MSHNEKRKELNFNVLSFVSLGVTRRRLMKLSLIGFILAQFSGNVAYSAEPKQGGFARFALAAGATTDTLDPGSWADTFGQTAFFGTIYNNLVQIDPTGKIVGDLADQFEASDNGKTWTFHLHPGVKFHDGRDFSGRDVVASVKYHTSPNSRSAAKPLFNTLVSVTGDGLTVIFKLSESNFDFPYLLADQHMVMMPANAAGVAEWEKGIGTGPFVLTSFRPGVSVLATKNPHYFKPGLPHFDKVEFLPILDAAARATAIMSGEVQYIASPDLKTLSLLQRNKSIKTLENTGLGHYTFPMNVTIAPFNDPNVRLALKYALNREDILNKVFLGHGLVGNDNPIAPSMKYFVNPTPQYAYDPEKARAYLKKSNLDSLKVDLHVSDAAFAGAVDAALIYKESAAKAGITINVVREPTDGYFDNVWMKRPWFASFWSGRPSVDGLFSTAVAADAPWNETQWKDPRFNELLLAARSEPDEQKRAAMYAEMQQRIHDDGGDIVLVFNNFVSAYSDKLDHGVVAPHWDNDGFRIAERWWFK